MKKVGVVRAVFFDIFKFMSVAAAKGLVLWISLTGELRLEWNIYCQSAEFYGVSLKETQELKGSSL